MLYTLKMTKEEIEQIIMCLDDVSEDHKRIMLKYGMKDELIYTQKLKSYLLDEMELQDRQLQDKLNKG